MSNPNNDLIEILNKQLQKEAEILKNICATHVDETEQLEKLEEISREIYYLQKSEKIFDE